MATYHDRISIIEKGWWDLGHLGINKTSKASKKKYVQIPNTCSDNQDVIEINDILKDAGALSKHSVEAWSC